MKQIISGKPWLFSKNILAMKKVMQLILILFLTLSQAAVNLMNVSFQVLEFINCKLYIFKIYMERNQEPNRKYNFFLPEGEWVQLSDLDIVWLGAQLHQILHIYSFNPIKAGGSGSMYSLGGASHAPPP